VVEDDETLSGLLCTYLERNGYDCTPALDGISALEKIESRTHQLILLDLGLPNITGEQILRQLKDTDDDRPVLVITADDSPESELFTYKNGSRLFHRKPINCKLLLYQIESILHGANADNYILEHYELSLDKKKKSCTIKGNPIQLTPTEYKVLEYLLINKNRLITKQELSMCLYSDDDPDKWKNIDTVIFRVRKKLTERIDGIQFSLNTYKGFGYRIEP
jgi:DNA-binding response OmpR family regulator